MFKKILIANRGEIAVRIMATCREMGIRTVAVYSDVDRNARHVRFADEAYFIGPAPATQSYLRIETILAVAKQSGAEAIHPGYGFLSENADFVEACEQAGIVFIGPSAQAMRAMGGKISAKQIARSVDAPTVPGYAGESQDETVLFDEAQRIGFPLLIKASAGGGGKGMREVHSANDFVEQLAGAKREALASFGDDTVFLERLIQQPRHIEIQILGDAHGSMIHLGERECSIQRRHQKIVEESPSIALTPALRAEMGVTAVRIAQAAGYVNAGTMEFIFDSDNHYYFLEMNTRLQVEHPVTELVTGIDLVRHQLLIATGEPLALIQEQVQQRGHAIEVRIYAEDAEHGFLPSTGTIDSFQEPAGPGVRVDSGVEDGDEIPQFYDPMIAKLIVYGENRDAAIVRLQRSLEQSAIFGVTTNIPLLSAIAKHYAFREGSTHTSFLQEHHLLDPVIERQPPQNALIAAAIYDTAQEIQRLSPHNGTTPSQTPAVSPWQTLGPWRLTGEARTMVYAYQGQTHNIALTSAFIENAWNVSVDGQTLGTIAYAMGNESLLLLKQDKTQVRVYVYATSSETQVMLNGVLYRLERREPPDVDATAHGSVNVERSQKTLVAPMAGTIVKVQVHDGDTVEAQQVLVILSAMKMEHAITTPRNGKVRHVYYQEGAVVKGGAVIVELE